MAERTDLAGGWVTPSLTDAERAQLQGDDPSKPTAEIPPSGEPIDEVTPETDEHAAAAVPAETPGDAAVEEPSGEAEPPDGEEETPPEEPPTVPVKALLAERNRRQRAERLRAEYALENEALRRQVARAGAKVGEDPNWDEIPTMKEFVSTFEQRRLQPVLAELEDQRTIDRVVLSQEFARAMFDDYDEVLIKVDFSNRLKKDPALRNTIGRQAAPALAAYDMAKQELADRVESGSSTAKPNTSASSEPPATRDAAKREVVTQLRRTATTVRTPSNRGLRPAPTTHARSKPLTQADANKLSPAEWSKLDLAERQRLMAGGD